MMTKLTFITGNAAKAEQLGKMLGVEVDHRKLDLPEIQSLDFREVVEAKARAAYEHVHGPVLVEDSGVRFTALGRLPGTLTKWFEKEMGNEKLCRLVDGVDRGAVGEVWFCCFDGTEARFFEGTMAGQIAEHPQGENGFGWDPIFVNAGQAKSRAEMTPEEYAETSMRKPAIAALETFLRSG
jgi:non-canonical purine NTP pyrophosphatase (RdgB/HAM1 family)